MTSSATPIEEPLGITRRGESLGRVVDDPALLAYCYRFHSAGSRAFKPVRTSNPKVGSPAFKVAETGRLGVCDHVRPALAPFLSKGSA